MTAMQTEIRGLKTELGKIKNLESTVAIIEKSIEISQQSQDRLEKKFDKMNYKLELVITRLGINIDSMEPTRRNDSESEMEEESADETPELAKGTTIPEKVQSTTSHIQARRTYASSQSTGLIPKKQKGNSSAINKKC